MGGHGLHVGGCADEADEPRKTCGSYPHEYLELRTANREYSEEARQRQRIASRDQQKEKKEQQVHRQLNETHAEVLGSSDPESHDDDSLGALGDADGNDGENWESVVSRVSNGPKTLSIRPVQQANERSRVLKL